MPELLRIILLVACLHRIKLGAIVNAEFLPPSNIKLTRRCYIDKNYLWGYDNNITNIEDISVKTHYITEFDSKNTLQYLNIAKFYFVPVK